MSQSTKKKMLSSQSFTKHKKTTSGQLHIDELNDESIKRQKNRFSVLKPIIRPVKSPTHDSKVKIATKASTSEANSDNQMNEKVISKSNSRSASESSDAVIAKRPKVHERNKSMKAKAASDLIPSEPELLLEMSSDEDIDPSVDNDRDPFKENINEVKFDDQMTNNVLGKISNISPTKASKSSAIISDPKEMGTVIYLGHIPHGFYEDEMKGYFSQFGVIRRLRLSRSSKTGRSRSYAFIEFEDANVAEIVADTMNDYLMLGHRLKASVMPRDKVHPLTFQGHDRPVHIRRPSTVMFNKQEPKSKSSYDKMVMRLLHKETKRRSLLQEMGIDYEYGGYKSVVEKEVMPMAENTSIAQ